MTDAVQLNYPTKLETLSRVGKLLSCSFRFNTVTDDDTVEFAVKNDIRNADLSQQIAHAQPDNGEGWEKINLTFDYSTS